MRLLTVLLLLLGTAVHAQDAPAPRPAPEIWLEGGVGLGGAGAGPHTEAGGHLSARMAATLRQGRLAATLRATTTSGGPSPYSGPFTFGARRDGFHEAGALVGYVHPVARTVELSAAAGLAAVWGSRVYPGDCGYVCSSSGRSVPFRDHIGVPVELRLSVRLHSHTHLGVVGYADVNSEEAFGGAVVTVSRRLWPFS